MAAFLVLMVVAASDETPAPSRPNVLFIAIDDLNDWVGPLAGHPNVKTPCLDRLAARGTTFTNAHCQSPLCNPSRTSLLLGLRPSTTGIYALAPWFRHVEAWRGRTTLPQHFANAGYTTLACGKVFHDAYPPREDRQDGREFTVWGYHGTGGPRPPEKFVHTPQDIQAMDWGPFPDRDPEVDDWKVADWAIERLRSPPAGPWFLSVGFRRPHVPCFVPQKWFDLYPLDTLDLPAAPADDRDDTPRFSWYLHWRLPEPRLDWLRENGQWEALVRAYLASISFVDAQIGRVIDALDESGQADRTIVVLWSDHGWHLGEKGITGKNSLWERSTRVPLMVVGPGIGGGRRCSRPVELLDVYPTLIELCRLERRDDLEGHSLTQLLENPNAERPWPAITTHNQGNHAIRTERYRLIRYADGSQELYDHELDPHEWTNLADDVRFDSIRAELAKWLPTTNAVPVAGSAHRLLTFDGTTAQWEGTPIGRDAPIPK
jgi:arylsulfatase A-like enzyme